MLCSPIHMTSSLNQQPGTYLLFVVATQEGPGDPVLALGVALLFVTFKFTRTPSILQRAVSTFISVLNIIVNHFI